MSDPERPPTVAQDTAAQACEEFSDLGNARRFIRLFGETVRWVEARGELHPGVVRWLQEATLSAPTRAERRAGVVPRVVERGRALEAKEVGR
jgi:hypothetical protein